MVEFNTDPIRPSRLFEPAEREETIQEGCKGIRSESIADIRLGLYLLVEMSELNDPRVKYRLFGEQFNAKNQQAPQAVQNLQALQRALMHSDLIINQRAVRFEKVMLEYQNNLMDCVINKAFNNKFKPRQPTAAIQL